MLFLLKLLPLPLPLPLQVAATEEPHSEDMSQISEREIIKIKVQKKMPNMLTDIAI
jgi:hypothetical protein